mmetsp:Transcript_39347/g.70586  ORF Transcript_39347/g.70586 Transcript_39347/m.70586 type:complete len:87 (+) Transcript_39347:260-520(+)
MPDILSFVQPSATTITIGILSNGLSGHVWPNFKFRTPSRLFLSCCLCFQAKTTIKPSDPVGCNGRYMSSTLEIGSEYAREQKWAEI